MLLRTCSIVVTNNLEIVYEYVEELRINVFAISFTIWETCQECLRVYDNEQQSNSKLCNN